jgi:aryl-alcohol dehydrogenase-like predicted oxidoreductase
LLVHDASDLTGERGSAFVASLDEARSSGLVSRVGVSVYSGDEIEAVLDVMQPDIVQLPVSVFDQRLVRNGGLARLAARGIEVHGRSAFLQGFALMDPDAVPRHLRGWVEVLTEFDRRCEELGVSRVQGALGWACSLEPISVVVCGVNDAVQFAELVDAARASVPIDAFESVAVDDVDLVDPRRWRP